MPAQPHILMLLTNAFDPDPRVQAEAQALIAAGYRVSVLCWDRSGRYRPSEQFGQLAVRRIRIRSADGLGLGQLPYLLAFWLGAARLALSTRFDVLHCHDLDTLPAGWLLARLRRCRLVYDAHESYPDMMSRHLPRPAVRALASLERLLLPHCHLVLTVSQPLARHLSRHTRRRPVVVPNAKDPARYQFSPSIIQRTRRMLGFAADDLLVGYIANLGPDRLIAPLIEAVADQPRLGLLIAGDGPQRPLAARAHARHRNIRYLGTVRPERVPLLTACCDVIYYGLHPASPNARYSAPNKLFEALAAGKALLTTAVGPVGRIARRHRCGIAVESPGPQQLRTALTRLAQPECLWAMQARARQLGQTRYNWSRATRRLLGAYRRVCTRPACSRPRASQPQSAPGP